MNQLMVHILKEKNHIMMAQGIMIVIAFLFHFTGNFPAASEWLLLGGGIIGTIPILIQAISSLKIKLITIDVLVAIAAIGALMIQNYEEAAIVTFLFLFGAWLEGKTLAYTRSSIQELSKMAPEFAWVEQADGEFKEVEIDWVEEGDRVLVKTGSKVPVDGFIIQGQGSLNEASITGESMLRFKEEKDPVFAGSILENGTLQVITEKVGEETTFGKIIELVEEAQDNQSETEKTINRFAKWYTPLVLVLGLVVGLLTRDVELAITILVLGCPGALVIGVPVSNVAGIGNGAKNGVLLKGSEVVQNFAKIDTMIFDKTGTLTVGNAKVNREIQYDPFSKESLSYFLAVEKESSHPLAVAILDYYGDQDLVHDVQSSDTVVGGGMKALVNQKEIVVGNRHLMEQEGIALSPQIEKDVTNLQEEGHSIVLVAVEGSIMLLLGIKDMIRPGVKKELLKLKKMGVKELILASGDNQQTVDQVAKELGIDQAYGNMLPQDKAQLLDQLQADGKKVAFIGDGINDSPSIAKAEVGIAMGSGTDVAIESSDVVLVQSDFDHLVHAYGLSQTTDRNMKQNIIIALLVVVILIGLLLFSPWMNLTLGMLVHEGSILVVILNAIRLLKYQS